MTNEQIAQDFYQCINDKDMDRLTRYVSDKCKYIDVPQGKTLTGKNAPREDCETWLTGFPDGKVQVLNQIVSGDWVVTEFVGRGTHTGLLGKGTDALPATHQKVELHFCDVMLFQGGKIISVTSYYDLATLTRQLEAGKGAPRTRPEARPH